MGEGRWCSVHPAHLVGVPEPKGFISQAGPRSKKQSSFGEASPRLPLTYPCSGAAAPSVCVCVCVCVCVWFAAPTSVHVFTSFARLSHVFFTSFHVYVQRLSGLGGVVQEEARDGCGLELDRVLEPGPNVVRVQEGSEPPRRPPREQHLGTSAANRFVGRCSGGTQSPTLLLMYAFWHGEHGGLG